MGISRLRLAGVVALALLVIAGGSPVAAREAAPLAVCATCAYPTIDAAIAAAEPGATIEVHGGVYAGPLVVARAVSLRGVGTPVIDGRGRGTVVRVTAPDVTIEGFVIRNSGDNFDREDSAVAVEAPRATIRDNQLLNDLFGVNLRQAPSSRVERNTIIGKEVAEAIRGDGIKAWYSPAIQVLDNQIDGARDCLIWYSDDAIVRGNTVGHGRYGLHVMNSNGALIERNRLEADSVGVYLMYGRAITVRDNLVRGSRGPSGQGIGVKEIDGTQIERNNIIDNRIGIYIDNSPLSNDIYNHVRGNLFAYNDSGLGLLPADRHNIFSGNNFVENLDQVSILGGGHLGENQWSADGVGNFWSDYVGYDADRDGVGDVPYRSDRLTEQLMDTQPILRLYRYSVAALTIDFAARAFPAFRADAKIIDPTPLIAPRLPTGAPVPAQAATWPVALFAAFALLMAGGIVGWGRRGMRATPAFPGPDIVARNGATVQGDPSGHTGSDTLIEMRAVSKFYGDHKALDSVTLAVRAGEALALWGPNGAGKTTLLRCLMGVTNFAGEIRVMRDSLAHHGTAVRRLIGYVPQEMPTFDMSVGELVRLIARLRSVEQADALRALQRFNLAEHAALPVGSLSGGMKQKLALAIALLGDPPILLLDEPTANLDASTQAELLGMLLSLKRQGRTIIFTSHRWHEVSLLADTVVYLDQGRQIDGSYTHPDTTRELVMRVALEANALDGARELLLQRGFAAHRNGKAVLVAVARDRKADALALLVRSGYVITDFDIEDGSGG